jgi:Ni,Fe-hydrogenase III small subunit/ferredoxin
MAWLWRGLRDGIVTTPYPKRPDSYGAAFHGAVTVRAPSRPEGSTRHGPDRGATIEELCPTNAISVGSDEDGAPTLDRGRCILCGRCIEARPDLFTFETSPEVATIGRGSLVVPSGPEDDETLRRMRAELYRRVRALRRSVHVRHVDGGSDGAEEWEIAALNNPVYDVQRLGIYFTATPRHADILLATGVGTAGMVGPLRRTHEAMPDPKVVIAAGTDAVSGGLVHPTYSSGPGVGSILPVDVFVPGSPASPFSLLHGILLAIGILPERNGHKGPA